MRAILTRCLFIGLAGFCGSVARYGVSALIGRLNVRFPLGTLFVNISGSLVLGWFMAFASPRDVSDTTRLAVAVGFVGAYTTFSTYMYETSRLADDGQTTEALVNLVGSMVLGLVAVRLGMLLGRRV